MRSLSWARGRTLEIVVTLQWYYFSRVMGDQSCIKLAPHVCVSLQTKAVSVSRCLSPRPPPSAELDRVSVGRRYKGGTAINEGK